MGGKLNVSPNVLIIAIAEIGLIAAIFSPNVDASTKSGAIGALAGSLGTRLALSSPN